jgi:hypothetical protein
MATPESQELLLRIDELINATRKGSFQWKAVNPTTYLWEKMDPAQGGTGAKVTLQRVENVSQRIVPGRPVSVVRQPYFILQVTEIKPGTPQMPMLNASGATYPELNSKLQELFQLAASGLSQQGLEFLKNLIPQS